MSLDREIDTDAARAAAAALLPETPHVEATVAPEPEPEAEPAQQPAPNPEASRTQLAAMIGILLDKVTRSGALRFGEHWNLDDAERDAIAAPLCEIVEREFGSMANTPEDRLILALGFYAVPRLLISITTNAPNPPAPASTSSTLEVSGERVK